MLIANVRSLPSNTILGIFLQNRPPGYRSTLYKQVSLLYTDFYGKYYVFSH
jgi:hypothetical protein